MPATVRVMAGNQHTRPDIVRTLTRVSADFAHEQGTAPMPVSHTIAWELTWSGSRKFRFWAACKEQGSCRLPASMQAEEPSECVFVRRACSTSPCRPRYSPLPTR
jgi:hypothetical protein